MCMLICLFKGYSLHSNQIYLMTESETVNNSAFKTKYKSSNDFIIIVLVLYFFKFSKSQ